LNRKKIIKIIQKKSRENEADRESAVAKLIKRKEYQAVEAIQNIRKGSDLPYYQLLILKMLFNN